MKDKSSRKQKTNQPKNKVKLRLGRIAIVLGILVYFFMFAYSFLGQLLKTYIVTYGEIEESQSAEGYVIRDEKVVFINYSSTFKPLKSEGERVPNGAIVATVYKESPDQLEKKIIEIEDKIQTAIKEYEKNRQLGKILFTEDISKLDQEIQNNAYEICQLVNRNSFEDIIQLKQEIDQSLRKRAEISGEFGPATQYIKGLNNEKGEYERRLAALREDIRSDCAGVVSYNIDGMEEILTPDSIPQLNINQLTALEGSSHEDVQRVYNSFKIVDNFKCFIAAVIEKKQKEQSIGINQRAWLRFLESEEELVPAVVHHISEEKDGRCLVTFKITDCVENLLNNRKISLDVVWSTYSGLKVPTSSLVKKKFISCTIEDWDKNLGIETGEDVTLTIPGADGKPLPATIYSISAADEGKTVVVFKLNTTAEELVDGQELNMVVNWISHPYTKLRIDSFKCEEREGVLEVDANYTKFREVQVLKRNSEYAVIKEVSSIFNRGISLYDEIILDTSSVEEGRQVRKWNF